MIPFDKLKQVISKAEIKTLRAENRLLEAEHSFCFYVVLKGTETI